MKTCVGLFIVLIGMVACAPAPHSGKGFQLPDGDPAKGREIFSFVGCDSCHTLPDAEAEPGLPDRIVLGGEVTRVKTYGDLVTSIINPSHTIRRDVPDFMQAGDDVSMMDYAQINDRITITELIDLVAFLQEQYEVVPPDIDPYVYYYK